MRELAIFRAIGLLSVQRQPERAAVDPLRTEGGLNGRAIVAEDVGPLQHLALEIRQRRQHDVRTIGEKLAIPGIAPPEMRNAFVHSLQLGDGDGRLQVSVFEIEAQHRMQIVATRAAEAAALVLQFLQPVIYVVGIGYDHSALA